MTMVSPCTLQQRLPAWLKVRLAADSQFSKTQVLLGDLRLNTVCESAECPNHWECWGRGTAAVMIAGDRCTRACGFCAVTTGKPKPLEVDEPQRVAEAVARMGLRHVVITAVARDDLRDGGADHFAKTIRAIKARCEETTIEVLTPDFNGSTKSIDTVLAAKPEVFNHNLETVERLTPLVRWRATYERSLSVLSWAKRRGEKSGILTKSGLMLGFGEGEEEVRQALVDLRHVGCEMITIGQYLRPTVHHLSVKEFVPPHRFAAWAQEARAMGFTYAAAGPLVRSSYYADEFVLNGVASKIGLREK